MPGTVGAAARRHANRLRRLGLVGLLTALAVILVAISGVGPATAASQTFKPTADAYVSAAQPSGRFGTETRLKVDASPVMRAYIRFNVQNVSGAVTSATLRLYTRTSSNVGVEVRSVSSSGWTETDINYANAPTPSATVTRTSGAFSSDQWISVDVTPLVAGNGSVSFALTTTSSAVSSFSSRENSSKAPQLVVVTGTPSLPPSGGDPVIAGAGDIATSGGKHMATADVLGGISPAAVFTTGDNAYPDGTLAQFNSYYEPSWGRFKSKTYPVPGNHDYHVAGASAYFGYFGSRAPAAYYAWNIGAWRMYALNSEIAHDVGSAQITWLKQDLANNPKPCVGAYWHKPLFSSALHGNISGGRPFWDALYAANADLIIVGHDHTYERFAPQTPSGQRDTARGIREFVVGTGGAATYAFTTIRANSEVRKTGVWGVLKLTLHPSSYEWRFGPISGQTFVESGSQACH
jgi:Calcineurin-like phosphoesterase